MNPIWRPSSFVVVRFVSTRATTKDCAYFIATSIVARCIMLGHWCINQDIGPGVLVICGKTLRTAPWAKDGQARSPTALRHVCAPNWVDSTGRSGSCTELPQDHPMIPLVLTFVGDDRPGLVNAISEKVAACRTRRPTRNSGRRSFYASARTNERQQ